MVANPQPRKPRRQNQLQLAEYICWVSSAMGTVVASISMQFAYAGVPLSLSLLLNLANRRRIEVSTHQRAMGAVVRVQQQLSQDLAAIEQRLHEVAERHTTEAPTQSQQRLQQLHHMAQQTSESQMRIRDLEDFRLVYQEIVSLQAQHRHMYESLAATIDYLNDSPLPQRVDEIEAAMGQLRRDLATINLRLARQMPIDVVHHADDTLDVPSSDPDLSGGLDDLGHFQGDADIELDDAVLDRIFEAERQREQRTITLPLEQFAARADRAVPDEATGAESEPEPDRKDIDDNDTNHADTGESTIAATFATNAIRSAASARSTSAFAADAGTTAAVEGVESTEDAVFDADILTDILTDDGANTPGEVTKSAPIAVEPRTTPTGNRRSTINLFSPHGTTADPNAIAPFEPEAELRPSETTMPSDDASVSFSLSSVAAPPAAPSTAPIAVQLPAIAAEADPPPPATPAANAASVPPQDWQRLSTLTDHGDWVSDLVIDPTGTVLISASFDRTIQFWDLRSGASLNILSEHSSPVCAIALSREQGWLVSGSWDRTIKIWEAETQTLLETLLDDSGVAGSVRSLAVSPNGRFIASGWFDRTIAIWDVRITPKRRKVSVSACGSQQAHGGRVDAITFDPTGKLLASASADGTVKLWSVDANTGELALWHTLTDNAEPINAITFSRDGMALVDASRDRTIRVWDVETGQRLHRLTGHSSSVTALAAHPDGETLISGSSDGTVRLWHLPTGQAIGTLAGSRDAVMSVAVSDDGQILVSGSADGSIDVWRRWGAVAA